MRCFNREAAHTWKSKMAAVKREVSSAKMASAHSFRVDFREGDLANRPAGEDRRALVSR